MSAVNDACMFGINNKGMNECIGGTRIFELGAARGQGVGHRGQTKIIVIGLSIEKN